MNMMRRYFGLRPQIWLNWRKIGYILPVLGASVFMVIYNNVLFHTVAEGFNIILAALVYVLAVKTFRYSRSNPLLFIGYTYFFTGFFLLLHIFTDSGLKIFPGIDAIISSRFNEFGYVFQAAALLMIPVFTQRRFSRKIIPGVLSIMSLLLILASITDYLLPYSFQVNPSLSQNIFGKLLIVLLFSMAIIHLFLKRQLFNQRVYRHILTAVSFTLIAVTVDLLIGGNHWFMNWLGHGAKIMATLRIYQLVITFGIEAPYDLIFRELKSNAVLDALTGIYNRNGLVEFVKKELARGRKEDSEIGLLLIDIDNFKGVNDRYGHLVGDKVLKSFAVILKTTVRENDIICRLGGDEFVVLIKGDRESLELVRWRIREAFQSWQQTDQMARKIGLSIGSTICESGERLDIEQLIKEADLSMYNEKTKKKSNKKVQDTAQLTMFGADID